MGNNLEVDHIIPISKGGKTTMDNLQTSCKICNMGKKSLDNFEVPVVANLHPYSPNVKSQMSAIKELITTAYKPHIGQIIFKKEDLVKLINATPNKNKSFYRKEMGCCDSTITAMLIHLVACKKIEKVTKVRGLREFVFYKKIE